MTRSQAAAQQAAQGGTQAATATAQANAPAPAATNPTMAILPQVPQGQPPQDDGGNGGGAGDNNGGGGGGVPPDGGGGGGGGGPPAMGQAQPAPVIQFALAPSQAHQGLIDYKSRVGQNLYASNTAPLEMTFDCSSENLLPFIRTINNRAQEASWTLTRQVPMNGMFYDLFRNFGMITVAALTALANTFINTETRAAQDSFQMFYCLHASLTDEARNRVHAARAETYMLPMANGNVFPEGMLYLKAITQTAQVDTMATVNKLSKQITSLDELMVASDNNVDQFNLEVNSILTGLAAREVPIDDRQMVVNLFKGYKACSDKTFGRYVESLYDGYDDGTRTFTPDGLMELALNKYNGLLGEDNWMAETAEQKEIVALRAEVTTLHKRLDNKKKAKSDKKAKGDSDKKKKKKRKDGDDKGGDSKKGKYPAWKLVAPEANAPKTKEVKGKTFYWCKHHKLWTAHKESDCEKGKHGSNNNTNDALRPDVAALNANTGDDDSSI